MSTTYMYTVGLTWLFYFYKITSDHRRHWTCGTRPVA